MENTRICYDCKIELPITHFYLRKSGRDAGKHAWKCKRCTCVETNKWKQDNPERALIIQRNKTKKKSLHIREFIDKLKNVPCADCRNSYPPFVMDFDHVMRTKLFSVGRAVGLQKSDEAILSEVAKCEVVCSNCHRIRTHG